MNHERRSCMKVLVAGMVIAAAMSACSDSSDVRSLDAKTADQVVQRRSVTIPDAFSFGQMTEYGTFQGRPSYSGRYDGPAIAFEDAASLNSKNPEFPPMRPVLCEDPILASPGWGSVGFSCTKHMLVTQHPLYGVIDTVTLLLTSDGVRAHLFIRAVGN